MLSMKCSEMPTEPRNLTTGDRHDELMLRESMKRRNYPEARNDDTQDILAGVSFPDPFRWLEGTSDEVEQWQRAQAELASSHVREWPHFERLVELVKKFNTERG